MSIDLYGKLPKNFTLITHFIKLCAYLALVLAGCSTFTGVNFYM
jgi:hypothetical protein